MRGQYFISACQITKNKHQMNQSEVEILLVEDSMEDAELTIRALRKNDVAKHIVHLKNGADALDFLLGRNKYAKRDLTCRPRLVLLDLKMPKVSGLEVLEQLMNARPQSTIPIVVLTSSKEDPDIEKAYLLGANSYIVKPVDFPSFIRVVNQLGSYWLHFNQPVI
jgi:two-component system response regulator